MISLSESEHETMKIIIATNHTKFVYFNLYAGIFFLLKQLKEL